MSFEALQEITQSSSHYTIVVWSTVAFSGPGVRADEDMTLPLTGLTG